MRPLLTIAACLAIAATAMGQGTVNFANRVTTAGINAPIYMPDGTTPAGSSIVAQLWAGTSADSLSPVGAAVTLINSGGNPTGFFVGGSREIPGITPAGGAAFVQVRAWEATYSDYATAAATPNALVGQSAVLNLAATGNPTASPPGLPVNMLGLTSFNLTTVIPEPATLALLGLGALGLLIRRRK